MPKGFRIKACCLSRRKKTSRNPLGQRRGGGQDPRALTAPLSEGAAASRTRPESGGGAGTAEALDQPGFELALPRARSVMESVARRGSEQDRDSFRVSCCPAGGLWLERRAEGWPRSPRGRGEAAHLPGPGEACAGAGWATRMRARWSWRRRKGSAGHRRNQPRGQPIVSSCHGLRQAPAALGHRGAATRRCLLAPSPEGELALRRQPRFWPCPPIRGGGLTWASSRSCFLDLGGPPHLGLATCGGWSSLWRFHSRSSEAAALGSQAINPERNCSNGSEEQCPWGPWLQRVSLH